MSQRGYFHTNLLHLNQSQICRHLTNNINFSEKHIMAQHQNLEKPFQADYKRPWQPFLHRVFVVSEVIPVQDRAGHSRWGQQFHLRPLLQCFHFIQVFISFIILSQVLRTQQGATLKGHYHGYQWKSN